MEKPDNELKTRLEMIVRHVVLEGAAACIELEIRIPVGASSPFDPRKSRENQQERCRKDAADSRAPPGLGNRDQVAQRKGDPERQIQHTYSEERNAQAQWP